MSSEVTAGARPAHRPQLLPCPGDHATVSDSARCPLPPSACPVPTMRPSAVSPGAPSCPLTSSLGAPVSLRGWGRLRCAGVHVPRRRAFPGGTRMRATVRGGLWPVSAFGYQRVLCPCDATR